MIHILYPYRLPVDKNNNGWELKYSIRSLYKNLKFKFDITIVGDIPNWINRDVVSCIDLNNHNKPSQRQSKINEKILIGMKMFDKFTVFNDDIMIMKKFTIKDLERTYHINDLAYKEFKVKKPNSYTAQLKNSYFTLKKLDKQYTKNFVSHTPHTYETDKLKEILEHIDLTPDRQGKIFPDNLSVLIENIYHNWHKSESVNAKDFRYGCWSNNCDEYKNQLLFNFDEKGANNNPWIKEFLENKFKDKSEAEL